MRGLGPIKTRTVHDALQDRIKEYVLVNDLQPGDPLPTEVQLADSLGVSRTGIREALRSLESLGVIYSRRGEGRYVSSFSLDPILQNLRYNMLFNIKDAQEILEVRQRLEESFIGEAVAAMAPKQLARVRAAFTRFREMADAGEIFLEEDLLFHRAVFEAVDNQVLLQLLDVFWYTYKNLRDQSLHIPKDVAAEVRNHAAILEAIEAGNAEEARRLLTEHFAGIQARLKEFHLGKTESREEAAAVEGSPI